ncbi:MAG: aminoacyl-tRNA hydrolase [Pseudomonadota bacterium]
MQLFVGLGNPGPTHARQRHNIGFMALDAIADWNNATPWRAKFQGEIAEARLEAGKVLLLKPLTFMNLSGQSVGEAARFYGIPTEDVTVFHDELDLAPGKLRVKRGGGHAGHNGLRSMHQHIGAEYARVRLGIGHPGHKDRVAGYVLHAFSQEERGWLEPLIDAVAREAGHLASKDDAGFMNAVARRLQPAKAEKPAKPAAKPPAAEAETARSDTPASASPFAALRGLLPRR